MSEVEPLLQAAKESVSSISKKALDELRVLNNPPSPVKMCIEAVVMLLTDPGERTLQWEDARKVLKSNDFIQKILNFDLSRSGAISLTTVHKVKTNYLKSDQWDLDKIEKASKTAYPLAKWAESSCSFAEIIVKVDPLRSEIEQLQKALETNKLRLVKTKEEIIELEKTLETLQREYAELIAAEQAIKKELDEVKRKLQTSVKLLEDLASEKERWSEESGKSQQLLMTDLGDNLLAASFATYIGFYEHREREVLLNQWREIVDSSNINCQAHLSFVDHLSDVTDRFNWQTAGLPTDQLSLENACILSHYRRYPLLIDPTGTAIEFVSRMYSHKKMTMVSCTNPNFIKQVESALRFGTALLIMDVEDLTPVLNNVLNRETRKVGGRLVITVGDLEVDFSPDFMCVLCTKDPNVRLTPDLTSRVTIVNYTSTPDSLRNQCLHAVLQSERPEIEKKRRDVLNLQGEFRARIRELEDQLLKSLSEVEGNILDDVRVVKNLETVKKQAKEVQELAANADRDVEEINQSMAVYHPLADSAARVITTLEYLSELHYLYTYDSRFVNQIFEKTLEETATNVKSTDYLLRAHQIELSFFKNLFDAISMSLLHGSRLTTALQFARIRFEALTKVSLDGAEFNLLTQNFDENAHQDSSFGAAEEIARLLDVKLGPDQLLTIETLSKLKRFTSLKDQIQSDLAFWKEWLSLPSPETLSPLKNNSSDQSHLSHVDPKQRKLCDEILEGIGLALLIKAFRPDRLGSVLESIVLSVMGPDFLDLPVLTPEYLSFIAQSQASNSSPVILISAAGFDVSGRVVSLADTMRKKLKSIALGSQEGYNAAEEAIKASSTNGGWVLLKNIHLVASKWLTQLAKNLSFGAGTANVDFRLFLTMEFSPKVPANLLRIGYKLAFEPPTGLKPTLERLCVSHLASRGESASNSGVQLRLYFLLTFLHALILERRRFVPDGWSKAFEFSDADFTCGLRVLEEWMERTHSSQDLSKIPFPAIQRLLETVVYGGRLDNTNDVMNLSKFVRTIVSSAMFEEGAVLGQGASTQLKAPKLFGSLSQYQEWIKRSVVNEEPGWIGLPPAADRALAAREALAVLENWQVLNNKSAADLAYLLPTKQLMV